MTDEEYYEFITDHMKMPKQMLLTRLDVLKPQSFTEKASARTDPQYSSAESKKKTKY